VFDSGFGGFGERAKRPEAELHDLADMLKESLGLDVETATVVATYKGDSGVRRWVLVTPDSEWVLVRDFTQASFTELLTGGGNNSVCFASAPLFLLTVDEDFQLSVHADVYEQVRDAMKTYGVKDGAPYVSLSNVSPTQSIMIQTMMKKLAWDTVDVVFEPIGTTNGAGITFYNDTDGAWKAKP